MDLFTLWPSWFHLDSSLLVRTKMAASWIRPMSLLLSSVPHYCVGKRTPLPPVFQKRLRRRLYFNEQYKLYIYSYNSIASLWQRPNGALWFMTLLLWHTTQISRQQRQFKKAFPINTFPLDIWDGNIVRFRCHINIIQAFLLKHSKSFGFLLTLYESTWKMMQGWWIIHYRLPVTPSVPLRGCRIQSLEAEGDTENQSPAQNLICARRRKKTIMWPAEYRSRMQCTSSVKANFQMLLCQWKWVYFHFFLLDRLSSETACLPWVWYFGTDGIEQHCWRAV